MILTVLLLPAGMMMCVAGCPRRAAPQPQSLPTISITLGKRTFTLEVANTNRTREIGLMHRDSMPRDHGMLFVFPDEQRRAFWMKNTRIPLDIIYLDAAGRIVAIKPMQPYDLSSVSSDRPAKYAIELNQGMAAEAGVRVGDVVAIPQAVAESAD
ncbi:DUF192 domain-containing protein [Fontivita pretiosa]|uniref:DUF192 domain-containing protein n=1 Tax=Fontivita pretiosa TaxID=2989684 RepID=UPI003D16257B